MDKELELLFNYDSAPAEVKAEVEKAKAAWLNLKKSENQVKVWGHEKEIAERDYLKAKGSLIRIVKTWDISGEKLAKPEEKVK